MLQTFRKMFHLALGLILILIGILGLILPVLNGTVFLVLGFILLSFEIPYIEKKLFLITNKYPWSHSLYTKLDKFLRKLFRK